MVSCRIVSSLEKCFFDQTPNDFLPIERLSVCPNEQASFQILIHNNEESDEACSWHQVETKGYLSDCVKIRLVESVPNYMPSFATPKIMENADDKFVRFTPGLYPDILMPATHGGKFPLINQQLHPLWVDIIPNFKIEAGEYKTVFNIKNTSGEIIATAEINITVLPFALPEQKTRVTNWFYADCLADYYEVDTFSDRHFEICENFIKTAVNNGINMIMMPLLTPPLDTAVNGERTTTQLLSVTVNGGEYSFDFSLVKRWLDMCERAGVKFIEVSHLFTQWGAYHAPKVMATVDGEYKRIFGWETDAAGDEYVGFLRALLGEFTAFMEKNGYKDKTYFHLSDEPMDIHLEQYRKNKENLASVLKGWKVLDAMSHVEFFKEGLCEIPVAITSRIEDFMKEDIKERWTYFCCGPTYQASNRFLAGSLPRIRSLGMQMYKYGIDGFLHWGYNFYNNQYSDDAVNPFINMTAGYWGVGGDAAVVYPGRKGMPLESIRLLVTKQAFDDIRLMQLCESIHGKERVIREIEAITGEIDFNHCIEDSETFTAVRNKLNELILATKEN